MSWTIEFLRQRFEVMPAIRWTPEPQEPPLFPDRAPASAAVLIPLVQRDEGLTVLLTQRTAHLNDHAGQISFPGGRTEPHDDGPVATALRETEEEVGLSRAHVRVLGSLPMYQTATNFQVIPVVAVVQPPFELKPDDFEVAEVFEVPLAFLMDPTNHQEKFIQTPGGPRRYFAMPYSAPNSPGKEYFIWGATAAMLRNLYNFLSAPL